MVSYSGIYLTGVGKGWNGQKMEDGITELELLNYDYITKEQ